MNELKLMDIKDEKVEEIPKMVKKYLIENLYGKKMPLKTFINEIEKKIIANVLEACNGNQKNAADLMVMKTTTLHEKIHRMEIKIQKKLYYHSLF